MPPVSWYVLGSEGWWPHSPLPSQHHRLPSWKVRRENGEWKAIIHSVSAISSLFCCCCYFWNEHHLVNGGEDAVMSPFHSVQFSHSVVSNSLRPHELQHARPPCPSPTPGVHSDSCPWCIPAISSSVVPFSSCPQSLLASQSFPMSQLFTWGGQSTGVSALASFLPNNT